MNKKEYDILKIIKNENNINQRKLADITGYSLGTVNSSIKKLCKNDYLDDNIKITEKTKKLIEKKSPKNAIILAAGYGMRMVPINLERPKGLIEVNGEPLIERVIKQLKEVDINEIYIVVGFMKEAYEYLIDDYGVKLINNLEYSSKNNLHSLKCAIKYLSNSYIIPCDVWCEYNPFSKEELYSWYMVKDEKSNNSNVRINSKSELILETRLGRGNRMIGIAYLDKEKSEKVKNKIIEMSSDRRFDNSFWEDGLFENDKMIVYAKNVNDDEAIEIDTYEQLRDLDYESKNLQNEAIEIAAKSLDTSIFEITNITVLKKGMTNRSFLFTCRGKKYIMRIPGEGTDKLINRMEEAAVYNKIKNIGICDNIIYISPETGYKITEFFEDTRCCDATNDEDVKKCMKKLKDFHNMNLKVNHEFNIFRMIDFYERLWNGRVSIYKDYNDTKEKIISLKGFIEKNVKEKCLTHIDAVPDNFLFTKDKHGNEEIKLIDWEYAGMQDPHVDIAMFGIYALYNRKQMEKLIDYYFEGKCKKTDRIKIYCYISACGLLWSNWCEYKRNLGIEFGEYSIEQYRYAKNYYKIANEELKKIGDD